VAVVVISSGGEGDQTVASLEVKAPGGWAFPGQIRPGGRATGQAAAKGEPGSPEIRAPLETDGGIIESAEPFRSRRRPVSGSGDWTFTDHRALRGQRGRHARKEWPAKARNHSGVASALPHSEGIAYKPPCGEVAMCPRVGRMGPVKRRPVGTREPDRERGPLGRRATHPSTAVDQRVVGPTSSGRTEGTTWSTKGRHKLECRSGHAGSRLNPGVLEAGAA
jgi:hypothetical protein